MLGLILPQDVTSEEVAEFADYFTAIGGFLKHRGIDIFKDELISRAITYFGEYLATKLIKHMRAGSLDAGVSEVLDIIAEIVYVENLYKYVQDRYKVDLKTEFYSKALLSDLTAWHEEMLILAKAQASYQEAYEATMHMVKEYWIHQPAQGRA